MTGSEDYEVIEWKVPEKFIEKTNSKGGSKRTVNNMAEIDASDEPGKPEVTVGKNGEITEVKPEPLSPEEQQKAEVEAFLQQPAVIHERLAEYVK